MLQKYAFSIQKKSKPLSFTPNPPVMAENINLNPTHLSWRGSAWAKGYDLEKRLESCTEWTRLATDLADNVPAGHAIFVDKTAEPNKRYMYRVRAKGPKEEVSEWLMMGPLFIHS